jgi:hypothetical protein
MTSATDKTLGLPEESPTSRDRAYAGVKTTPASPSWPSISSHWTWTSSGRRSHRALVDGVFERTRVGFEEAAASR